MNFNPEQSYKKLFKKAIDYFEPESDDFLLTELVFRELYNTVEQVA